MKHIPKSLIRAEKRLKKVKKQLKGAAQYLLELEMIDRKFENVKK